MSKKGTFIARFIRVAGPQQDNRGFGTRPSVGQNSHNVHCLGSGVTIWTSELLWGGFFRGGLAAISGYGPVLCFSGHKKHSANANTPLALLSRYNCVVEHEFISGSSQGLCSALTVNIIKIVCGRRSAIAWWAACANGSSSLWLSLQSLGTHFPAGGTRKAQKSEGGDLWRHLGGICRAVMLAPSLLRVRSDESPLLFPKDLFLCRHKLLLIIFFVLFFLLWQTSNWWVLSPV